MSKVKYVIINGDKVGSSGIKQKSKLDTFKIHSNRSESCYET